MKYLIVILIKGLAEKYQQKLLYLIAERFKVKGAIQRRPPAHLTLKSPFETNDIKPIESVIEQFCKSHQKSSYKLSGINHFDKRVIFIDVLSSEEMNKTYLEFMKHLKNKTKIQFKEFDGNTHFHSSLARTDIQDKFDEIWSFASKEKPQFDLFFDNISILKLVEGVWQIHKVYSLI